MGLAVPTLEASPMSPARLPSRSVRRTMVVLVGWCALIAAANRVGFALLDAGEAHRILSPPLIGRQVWRLGPGALLPILVGVAGVAMLPRLVVTLRWRQLLVVATGAALVWACSLALVDGWSWLQRPMALPGHYLLDVPRLGPPADLLRDYVARIDEFGPHVRAHPPLFVLLLAGLDALGLGGSGWAAALVILVGVTAVPAVAVTVREVAGERVARAALPFLVLAPASLYVATTADAFFAAVGAWAVAGVALATGRSGQRSDRLALLGGALFGVTIFLSYGLVLLALLPVVVAWRRRTARPILLAAAAGAAVVGLVAAGGFWWLEGLQATRAEYAESVARFRPYAPFLLINAAAFALITGPAAAAAVARLERGWLRLVVGSGLGMVALAAISGMSKGEVERIWLPFAWWVLPACAVLTTRGSRQGTRLWLSLQVATALCIQLAVRTHW